MQDIYVPRRSSRTSSFKRSNKPGNTLSEQTFELPPSYDNQASEAAITSDNSAASSSTSSVLGSLATGSGNQPKKRTLKSSLKRLIPHGRKQWIIAGAIAAFLLLAIIAGIFFLLQDKKPAPAPAATQTAPPPPPPPTTIASRLTGVEVPIEKNNLPVTGIMIENSPDARPQAGLSEAGVVFEAIAEGGITRFLALYLETHPTNVGPVRSARPYYLDWLQQFDASIAHVGGSPEALAQIKSQAVRDLDQFTNPGAYRRVNSRSAPHNMYTSLPALHELEKSKGFAISTFNGFLRKAEKPNPAITAKQVDFAISSPLYRVHYDYDPATNTYHRSQGGAGHIDENTKQVIKPKVVVALVTSQGIASDGQHTTYATTGESVAYIFQDGTVQEVRWKKATAKDQLQFVDAAGAPVPLNPGQTWISVVGDTTKVTYKP